MDAFALYNQMNQITSAALSAGVRPELAHAVMQQESAGNPDALSPKGASGLMQVMPATAARPGYGVPPFNPAVPEDNIKGGVALLKAYIDHFGGDEAKGLAAYNAGPGRVAQGGPLPAETQKYVPSVLARAGAPGDAFAEFNALKAPDVPVEMPAASQSPSSMGRFANGAWQNIKMLDPRAMAEGVAHMMMHPLDTLDAARQGVMGQFGQAKDAFDQGRYLQAAGHAAAGALPALAAVPLMVAGAPEIGAGALATAGLSGLGYALAAPAAGKAIDTVAGGDIAGGLGQMAGLGGVLAAPEIAGKMFKGVGEVASKGAERVIRSNVKPDMSLVQRNPGVNIPRTILDEGFGPGRRGFNKASGVVEDLSGKLSDAVDAADAKTGPVDLQPVLDHLDRLEEQFKHQPNATADLAAVRQAREALMNSDIYSKATLGPGPNVSKVIQVPEQTPLGGTVMRNKTISVPGPDIEVGRELVPQSLPEVDVMKKNVYQGLKGKYGKEGSGVIETDKAMGRGLKDILNENVPEAAAINARQSKVIVARNALGKMAEREANKYPIGLMDLVGLGGGGLRGPAAALLLKHPTTAFPIARVLDKAGATTRAMAPVAKAGVRAGVGGQQATRRPVTLAEAQQAYQHYLALQP